MRKSHSILILGIILATMCVSAFATDNSAAPSGVVNINTADAAQLSLLPRVGAKASQRIIDYRTQHGPFKATTDLMQVKGFGEKTYEGVRPYISVDGKTTLSAKVKSPRKSKANKPATAASM
ncbi:MAG TPA: helix-hairpin-helix domain-containing protein [Thermoanaerobaculia bacterium]|nr:helix-hairpin-helix domain-containing protein [Thermoanaerobaculia bacterium]